MAESVTAGRSECMPSFSEAGFLAQVWRRLRRDRAAMLGAVLVVRYRFWPRSSPLTSRRTTRPNSFGMG